MTLDLRPNLNVSFYKCMSPARVLCTGYRQRLKAELQCPCLQEMFKDVVFPCVIVGCFHNRLLSLNYLNLCVHNLGNCFYFNPAAMRSGMARIVMNQSPVFPDSLKTTSTDPPPATTGWWWTEANSALSVESWPQEWLFILVEWVRSSGSVASNRAAV